MIVKDMIEKLKSLDQNAIIVLSPSGSSGEFYGARHIEQGRIVSGHIEPGPDFKPDSMTDAEYFDGFDEELASIEYMAAYIS